MTSTDSSDADVLLSGSGGTLARPAGPWQGGALLRVAPTSEPWSIWYFRDGAGTFEGHYVDLELPHRRHGPETDTRDLVLALWLGQDGRLWLKDADGLEAAAGSGRLTTGMAEETRAVAEQARAELVEPRAWPLDQGGESWRPPAGREEALSLPDTPLVVATRERRTVSQ